VEQVPFHVSRVLTEFVGVTSNIALFTGWP
jgi:hypothetical protein